MDQSYEIKRQLLSNNNLVRSGGRVRGGEFDSNIVESALINKYYHSNVPGHNYQGGYKRKRHNAYIQFLKKHKGMPRELVLRMYRQQYM